jgi:predicted ATPase
MPGFFLRAEDFFNFAATSNESTAHFLDMALAGAIGSHSEGFRARFEHR